MRGFLSYVKQNPAGGLYQVFGYKGKQVRDNIHSHDVARFVEQFVAAPRRADVYNLGGGPQNSCSIVEAFGRVENITGKPMAWTYVDKAREGDHIWYVSNLEKLQCHYPRWSISKSLDDIFVEIVAAWEGRIQ